MAKKMTMKKIIQNAQKQEEEFLNRYKIKNKEVVDKKFKEVSDDLNNNISNFISIVNNTEIIPSSTAFKYDLKKLYKLKGDEQNDYIHEFLKNKLLTEYSPTEILNNKSFHYVYVVQRFDGMVCVVGRSHFKLSTTYNKISDSFKIQIGNSVTDIGDLFADIAPQKVSSIKNLTGTPKLIYNLLILNQDENVNDENLKDIQDKMHNYYKQAYVIPVQGGKNMANTIESLLGEYLILNNINILNRYSHM